MKLLTLHKKLSLKALDKKTPPDLATAIAQSVGWSVGGAYESLYSRVTHLWELKKQQQVQSLEYRKSDGTLVSKEVLDKKTNQLKPRRGRPKGAKNKKSLNTQVEDQQ